MADIRTKPQVVGEATEAQIAVHWREEEYYYPPAKFVGQANLTDPDVIERFSEKNFPECFREYADLLDWDQYWHTTLDTSDPPFWKWFVGGKINASYNCVDRHLAKYKNKAALIFVPEPESEAPVSVTYRELYVRVNEFAALLRDFCGLKSGDRVTIHMPMVPELPITMLACARLGVIHSVVFGGFSGEACGMRAADSGSQVLITMDGYYRNGKLLDHKAAADIALNIAKQEGQVVDKVLVWRRHAGQNASASPFVKGRDFWVDEILPNYSGEIVAPVPMDAEAPLFLMYTSGSTGKPKGCQHRTGGYLAYVTGTLQVHPGHSSRRCVLVHGRHRLDYRPLVILFMVRWPWPPPACIYEGVPTYPDAGRVWRIAERLDVNIFHTSPTAIRMLRKSGHDEPTKYNYHFKHMTTVGEPIEPEVWRWYYETVGKGEAVIVDTWWQTENGGFLCSTKPALDPMKPGSAGPGMPGIYPMIIDEMGEEVPAGSGKAGNICIRNPWPGIMQTIWGDRDRFVTQYYRQVLQESQQQELAGLAVLCGGRSRAGRRRIFPHPGTRGRRHQRGRPPPGHQGNRVGVPDGSRSGGSGGGAGGGRDQRPRARGLYRPAAGCAGEPRRSWTRSTTSLRR